MTLYHAFDASVPPTKPYPGTEIVCGYIGGDTPHVWTAKEWNAVTDNGATRMLPIYVRSNFSGFDPGVEARKAATAAHSLGWSPHIGRLIVLDSEEETDVAWIRAFGGALIRDGFHAVDYRSISVLIAHPSGLVEWAADFSLPPMPSSQNQSGFQYAADIPWDNTKVDVSIFDDTIYRGCGHGIRK